MARKDIEESEAGKKIAQKTGYNPVDLLKAPVEPPEPRNLGGPDANQIVGVAVGVGIIIGGLVGWLLVGGWPLLLAVFAGAICVVLSALVKPKA